MIKILNHLSSNANNLFINTSFTSFRDPNANDAFLGRESPMDFAPTPRSIKSVSSFDSISRQSSESPSDKCLSNFKNLNMSPNMKSKGVTVSSRHSIQSRIDKTSSSTSFSQPANALSPEIRIAQSKKSDESTIDIASFKPIPSDVVEMGNSLGIT